MNPRKSFCYNINRCIKPIHPCFPEILLRWLIGKHLTIAAFMICLIYINMKASKLKLCFHHISSKKQLLIYNMTLNQSYQSECDCYFDLCSRSSTKYKKIASSPDFSFKGTLMQISKSINIFVFTKK